MDNRPIGIFDSGLGGLTMVKELSKLLPCEDIIYLGDTGRVPYGPRSKETIIKYARQDANFLISHDVKAMIVACNSVCSVAFDELGGRFDIPVFEVISAPCQVAVQKTKNKAIGIIGTVATINSKAYEKALGALADNLTICTAPCPLFVPLAEEGFTDVTDTATISIAERYLQPLKLSNIDTLILGCTHYPLLREIIGKVMGSDVLLIDSGAETAKLVARELGSIDKLTESANCGSRNFFVTDDTKSFTESASRFLDFDIFGLVNKVSLE